MFRFAAVASLAVYVMFDLPVLASPLPTIVQDPVAVEQKTTHEACGAEPSFDDSFAQWIDLNNDGRDDVIINHGGAICMGVASFFCGSSGCSGSVYIARDDGQFELTDFPPEIKVVDWLGAQGVQVGYHGSFCGRVGADWCEEIWVWEDGAFVKRWQNY